VARRNNTSVDTLAIEAEVAQIQGMSKDELSALWRQTFHTDPPCGFTKGLIAFRDYAQRPCRARPVLSRPRMAEQDGVPRGSREAWSVPSRMPGHALAGPEILIWTTGPNFPACARQCRSRRIVMFQPRSDFQISAGMTTST
jgi:hypothetical protein